jgi:enoyl-CoA hydratase
VDWPRRNAILPLAAAIDRLQSIDALEAFSPLTGAPVLVVDLRDDAGRIVPEAVAAACARLAQLACPSIAIGTAPPAPQAAEAALVDRFDVVVDSEAAAAPILETLERAPLAAMALVQLLRQSAGLDLHDGLIAESFVYAALQGGREFASWLGARPRTERREPSRAPAVLASRSDGRLNLTLNRPERHNAFSAEMRDVLVAMLEIALADRSITEIVLRGTGPSFCSGGDLDEFGTLPDPATGHAVRSTRNAARCLAACAERTRAEVHGACVGAGIELPAFARRVVATRDAYFQLPEVAMGLVPGAGGTVSIPRRIGRQRTAYLALAGVRLDAPTALRWGLVDEIAG